MYHGVLLLNKPSGWTSHQLVQKVRKVFEQKKVGHCGTLDPQATGLMVLILGKACSLSSFLTNGDKIYQAQIQLGLVTDTLDGDGKILQQNKVQLRPELIQKVLQESQGLQSLKVPAFSAKKVGGKKLYEYARKGEPVPSIEKQMNFYDLKINSLFPDRFECQISCSKGSFVRAWVAFIGEKLKVGACLIGLKRLASHPYRVEQLNQDLSLEELRHQIELHQHLSCWIPYEEFQKKENELVQSR